MTIRLRSALLAFAVIGTGLRAQDSAATNVRDTLYVRAQRLVNEGKGDQGRAMVDSLLKASAPGSAAYAEGLFWRATLATTSAEAERDYRQITVDFPLSPRTQDALLRLAQMEIQRGDRALALAHLQRIVRENATGTIKARAAYWMARVYFEMNDVPRACTAVSESRAAILATDIELRNQVDYIGQRCPIASTTVSTQPQVVASAPAVASATTPATASATPPPAPGPVTDSVMRRDTVTTAVDTSSPPAVASPPAPVAAPTSTATPPSPTKKATTAAVEAQRYSVQVAAYGTAQEAQRLVKKYRANGHDARVAGTVAPFRVRIGRYKTRAEAVAQAKILKEKSGAAFVVLAEPK